MLPFPPLLNSFKNYRTVSTCSVKTNFMLFLKHLLEENLYPHTTDDLDKIKNTLEIPVRFFFFSI